MMQGPRSRKGFFQDQGEHVSACRRGARNDIIFKTDADTFPKFPLLISEIGGICGSKLRYPAV